MKILIIEDEVKIANAIKRGLSQQNYIAEAAYDADEGLNMAMAGEYDLIILDRMLPGSTDGIGILKNIRQKGQGTPVLLLTAKSRVLDKVEGLNAGADDYLAKPFAFLELLARVKALLRRPVPNLGDIIEYRGLKLDTNQKQAYRGGSTIKLSAKEYALLEYLIRNPLKTLSKEQIINNVWDYDALVLPNNVEVYIGSLRSKIDKPFQDLPQLIITKRGFGYCLGGKDV